MQCALLLPSTDTAELVLRCFRLPRPPAGDGLAERLLPARLSAARRPLLVALGEAVVAACVTLRPSSSQAPRLDCSVSFASGLSWEPELAPEAALAAKTRDAVASSLLLEAYRKSAVHLQLLVLQTDASLVSACVLASSLVSLRRRSCSSRLTAAQAFVYSAYEVSSVLTTGELALIDGAPALDPSAEDLGHADWTVSLAQGRGGGLAQLLVGGRLDRDGLRSSLVLAAAAAEERGRKLAQVLASS